MANPSWTNEEMNHHNSYSDNLTTPSESSCYSSESSSVVTRYSKIAACFENKTIRDVVVRSRWIHKKKENAKRRKEDHNGLGRARVDNKCFNHHKCFNHLNMPTENLDLFSKIRENINSLLKNLNENVSETWKQMPPLPEKLNDELFCDLYKAIERSSH
ncbi:predicted protein [Arabidopsis lyrata subsp. lyrata]|uniref:Predicted protein n=1 Tax=Arabidopsis lyrata subsp. lyrata TaxID=81972 RepID=D7MK77_ARALL|nr:predicted protein [Arabidopsis lyrata subsp. lyrata]